MPLEPNTAAVLGTALKFVEAAGEMQKAAAQEISALDKKAEALSAALAAKQPHPEMVTKVAKLLVEKGFVPKENLKEAEETLKDHGKALDVLSELTKNAHEALVKANKQGGVSLGAAVPAEKQASAGYDSLNGVVGERTLQRKASDDALYRLIGR